MHNAKRNLEKAFGVVTALLCCMGLSHGNVLSAHASDYENKKILLLTSLTRHIKELNRLVMCNPSNEKESQAIKQIDDDITQLSVVRLDKKQLSAKLRTLNYTAQTIYYAKTHLPIEKGSDKQPQIKMPAGGWPWATPWSKIAPGEWYKPGDG